MLSNELQTALNEAFKKARAKRHEFVTPEHLLLALLDDKEARDALNNVGADIDALRSKLEEFIKANTPLIPAGDRSRQAEPTLGFNRVVHRAIFHVQSTGKKAVTGADVLIALFTEQESQAVHCLKEQSIARLDVINYVAHGVSKTASEETQRKTGGREEDAEGSTQPALDSFANDLNELAKAGRVDPLVGRDAEVERVLQVLCRRRKNNPLLVGESGVGKTAIAEGLAKRIVDGVVPEVMAGSRVFALDLGALLAGTKYRGTSRSASRCCWPNCARRMVPSCSSTRFTPSSVPVRHPAG